MTVTSVDVSYEPSTLGDTNATLTISSSSGQYIHVKTLSFIIIVHFMHGVVMFTVVSVV